MLKNTLILVVLQFAVVAVNASQPMSLQKYLEFECNIIDPAATGLVSEDLVSEKACPEKSSLFCENGLAQAGVLLEDEIKKSNIYSDYVEFVSERREVVEILGNHYLVIAGIDLAPLVNSFWFEREKEIHLELSENSVSYKLKGITKDISLTVNFDADAETCDFTKPQIKVIQTKL